MDPMERRLLEVRVGLNWRNLGGNEERMYIRSILVLVGYLLVKPLREGSAQNSPEFGICGVWARGSFSLVLAAQVLRSSPDTNLCSEPHLPVLGWAWLAPKNLWCEESTNLGKKGEIFLQAVFLCRTEFIKAGSESSKCKCPCSTSWQILGEIHHGLHLLFMGNWVTPHYFCLWYKLWMGWFKSMIDSGGWNWLWWGSIAYNFISWTVGGRWWWLLFLFKLLSFFGEVSFLRLHFTFLEGGDNAFPSQGCRELLHHCSWTIAEVQQLHAPSPVQRGEAKCFSWNRWEVNSPKSAKPQRLLIAVTLVFRKCSGVWEGKCVVGLINFNVNVFKILETSAGKKEVWVFFMLSHQPWTWCRQLCGYWGLATLAVIFLQTRLKV